MKIRLLFYLGLFFALLISNLSFANLDLPIHPPKKGSTSFLKSTRQSQSLLISTLVLKAEGAQIYCPLSSINIVTDMTITSTDETGADAIYIQISSGYVNGEDHLTLNNALSHPTIIAEPF